VSRPIDELSDALRQRLRTRKRPMWMPPALATLTDERFSDPDWLFERKLDGERVLAFKDGKQVRLLSRNKKKLNAAYPEMVDALADQRWDRLIVDGEIVAFKGDVTSFARLQKRMQIKDVDEAKRSGVAIKYYLFDLLQLGDHDLRRLPLRARKKLLKDALRFESPLRFTPHRIESGEACYEQACNKGWEGVIAKRVDGTYAGKRTRDWLKFKCDKGQELVIGGFTDPKGSRKGFGALLVGYYDNGALKYVGRVGTGYDEETLQSLRKRMAQLKRNSCPFSDEVDDKNVTWVRPKLVAKIGFTEWTRNGRLRHPRFLGLRPDKKAREVRRERPGK
jgi:bifunctional non-homologous end joining protein LigD